MVRVTRRAQMAQLPAGRSVKTTRAPVRSIVSRRTRSSSSAPMPPLESVTKSSLRPVICAIAETNPAARSPCVTRMAGGRLLDIFGEIALDVGLLAHPADEALVEALGGVHPGV